MKIIKISLLLSSLLSLSNGAVNTQIETCEDEKCFKNLLKTRPSLMIVVSKTGKVIRGD